MISRLDDSQNEKKVAELYRRIEAANGFPMPRRLSLRDNDIVTNFIKVMRNDPSVTKIVVNGDERFSQIKKSLLLEFAESLAMNLHLESLTLKNVDLGNDFLSSFAHSIKSNFSLAELDLTGNSFTSEGLVEFCFGMKDNQSLRTVKLHKQRAPIMGQSEKEAMEALSGNRHAHEIGIDVSTSKCKKMIQTIEGRNKDTPKETKFDKKLIKYLSKEAKRAEELHRLQVWEEKAQDMTEEEWKHIYSLSKLAQQYKIQIGGTSLDKSSHHPGEEADAKTISSKLMDNMPPDGSFITDEFISGFLVEDPDSKGLVFAFNGQSRMFQKYDVAHNCRTTIRTKFVDTLLAHPDSSKIFHLNLTDSFCGNDLVEYLCEKCLANPKLLPKLNILDLETNYITDPGMVAISKCVENPKLWKFLQTLRLENQRHALGNRMASLSSTTELALAKAICCNRSVIRLSISIRNMRERHKIESYVSRNIDWLRQSRGRYEMNESRTRNELEQMIDQIAANGKNIDSEIDLSGNARFKTLHKRDFEKLAKGFAKNTKVTQLKINNVQLSDAFALGLAESLKVNTNIRVLSLEGNAISGDGITAIFAALKSNKTLQEIHLRHQTKVISSDQEESLAGFMEENKSVVRVGLDLRSLLARHHMDAVLRRNQDEQRKSKKPANGSSMPKKKNDMELFFEKVAKNDSSINEINLVNDRAFLSLSKSSRLEAAASLTGNSSVTTLRMNRLELDDEFACALAKSLTSNKTLEVVNLDSNAMTGTGILAILASASTMKEGGLRELQMRHQSKAMASADEEKIMEQLEQNESLVKLGLDIRNPLVTSKVQQKLTRNNDLLRKKRRSAK